jgi:RNA ligase (TIGR02306 family)
MRTLATIQRVRKISNIPESDFLELAHVMGWQCVIKKGEFREGDLGVYFEVDSFLPVEPRYEFLRKTSYRENFDNGEGFRIRTVKLRGQLSQGLILPLESFPEFAGMSEGEDVTEKVGVKKWYIPETSTAGGIIIGSRPRGMPTSDEIRVQSAMDLIERLSGKPYYITTKMDGTSGTAYYMNGKIGCCSRNKEIKDDQDALYWLPVYKYGLREKLAAFGKNIIIIGEICGPGIQKNKLRLPEIEWYVFDIIDGDAGQCIPYDKICELCTDLGIAVVPLEERGENFAYSLEELLEKAKGKYPSGLDKEGIVVRDTERPKAISFKVLNNDALLNEKD